MVSNYGQREISSFSRYLILSMFILSAANLGCGRKSGSQGPEATVHGGSMVPSFLGEHFEIKCADCQFSFSVDANEVPEHSMATCPNCGFTENAYPSTEPRSPTPIVVELGSSPLSRWDVLAFRFPNSPKYGIKRLVGLPGEHVEIRDGDIWIDGVLASRDVELKKEMRVQCFDSDCIPLTGPARLCYSDGSLPPSTKRPFQLFGVDPKRSWIAFQSVNCFSGPGNRTSVSSFSDNYGYNQTVSRGKLNRTQQLMVEAKIQPGESGEFSVFIQFERNPMGFHLNVADRKVFITQGDKILVQKTLSATGDWIDFLASTVDGELQLLVDGELVCQSDNGDLDAHFESIPLPTGMNLSAPVQMHAVNMSETFSVRRVQIYRDIYYTDRARVEFQLKDDEFVVLGDNSPVSVDSRLWTSPFLTSEQIIGKVHRSNEK